jgi:hypothetical protein
MNERTATLYLDNVEEMNDWLCKRAEEYATHKKWRYKAGDLAVIDVCCASVDFQYYAGYSSYDTLTIPRYVFTDPNWLEVLKEKEAEQARIAKAMEEARTFQRNMKLLEKKVQDTKRKEVLESLTPEQREILGYK